MIDAVRRAQLIRFVEDKARNYDLSFSDIAAYRDLATVLNQSSKGVIEAGSSQGESSGALPNDSKGIVEDA